MARIFITPDQLDGERLRVTGGDAHHLLHALRLGVGGVFTALDGTGREYQAEITQAGEGRLEARVTETRRRRTETNLRLTLAQALPKLDKLEQVIRQGTELGLAAFWPLISERCVAVPTGDRAAQRQARWERIAVEAAKQSGRAAVPAVAPLRGWADALGDFAGFDLVLLPWEGETERDLKQVLSACPRPANVLALIGPEGGLAQQEVAAARRAGAIPLTLGPRILRTETAGIVLAAAVFYHYHELSLQAPPDL